MEYLVKTLLAYMLGSVSGSLLVGTLRHVDIRDVGSGNAGGTNAFRTQGFWFALAVVVIDVGKGALAAWLIPALVLPGIDPVASMDRLTLICAFAAVFGHCFPLWHGFRGGKGAGTAVGALAVIQPAVLLPMILAWLLVLVVTGWVGLATILAALTMVPAFVWLDPQPARIVFSIVLALFIVFMHRSNIVNMLRGDEYRFERIRAANWFRR